MVVLVEILRFLREVADLPDQVWKSSPSFVSATVDDLAAEPAECVHAIIHEQSEYSVAHVNRMKGKFGQTFS